MRDALIFAAGLALFAGYCYVLFRYVPRWRERLFRWMTEDDQ